MISNEQVKQLYVNSQKFLAEHGYLDMPTPSPPQFFRGITGHRWKGQHPGSCKRHKSVFFESNVIPEYCFNCYKIFIEPRTIVELFKLMVVLEQLKLPNDNTRKCMVEDREDIAGTYKGFVYCTGIEESKTLLKFMGEVIASEISEKIPLALKRGCSEYALSYPAYAQIGPGETPMVYKEEWRKIEEVADMQFIADAQQPAHDTHNHPGYNLMDARIMYTWVRYAATIGDPGYLKLSGSPVPYLYGLERRFTFNPAEKE